MLNKLICLFFKHKKLCLNITKDGLIFFRDINGCTILRINVCERCGVVYWDTEKEKIMNKTYEKDKELKEGK